MNHKKKEETNDTPATKQEVKIPVEARVFIVNFWKPKQKDGTMNSSEFTTEELCKKHPAFRIWATDENTLASGKSSHSAVKPVGIDGAFYHFQVHRIL